MKRSKIFLAGHKGLLGTAIFNKLKTNNYNNIILQNREKLDLTRQAEVESFFCKEKPEIVILAAAKVGGITANISYPAQFIFDNISIQTNVINSSFKNNVKKLLFFGSACSYPPKAKQPIKEESLLSGKLEPTNEAYAIAKIAGIKMCQAYNRQYKTNFISVIPANIYGPGGNFNLQDAHVIPALLKKFYDAKIENKASVEILGTGRPIRDFVFVDDAADAVLFLLNRYNDSSIINIGSGENVSVRELAEMIKDVVGFSGKLIFNKSKPDGMLRKILDDSKLKKLGWKPKISLKEGIKITYNWFLTNIEKWNNNE